MPAGIENETRFQFSPHDSGGVLKDYVGAFENRELESFHQGLLKDFLRHEFFSDYLQRYSQDYSLLPDYVNNVLASMPLSGALLTGSVPKCFVSGIADHYWDYGSVIGSGELEEGNPIPESDRDVIKGFGLDTAADMDINGVVPVRDLFSSLCQNLKIAQDSIIATQFEVNGNATLEGYTITVPLPSDEHITMRVYAGPVPTNLSIETMGIAFLDSVTGQRIFRIDISRLPETGMALETEKRQGKTTKKQEKCVASLRVKDGNVWYGMTESAWDVIGDQDEILSESKDPNTILEIFLRGLRMNMLHDPREYIHDFESLLPEFTSASLFNQRNNIREALRSRQMLSPQVIAMLQKELLLCLTIDPYITIHALKDSGIARLIPGLSHITRSQWEDILSSRFLVVDDTRSQKPERFGVFLERQRRMYKHGKMDGKLHKPYNGIHMFIRALRDIGVVGGILSDLKVYKKLWDQPARRAIIDHQHNRIIIGDDFLVYYDQAFDPNTVEEEIALFKHLILELGASSGQSLETIYGSLTKAREKIYLLARSSYLHEEIVEYYDLDQKIREKKITVKEKEKFDEIDKLFNGISMMYVLLEQAPEGITARELKTQFEKLNIQYVEASKNFDLIFLYAKLLGFVYSEKQSRVNVKGKIVPVVFYSLHQSSEGSDFSRYQDDDQFLLCYKQVLENADRFINNTIAKSQLSRTINGMKRLLGYASSHKVDTFVSFTETDFNLLRRQRASRTQLTFGGVELFQKAYKLYKNNIDI
ncbi:hypothetical protein HY947_01600 [Candidatus Gottesmanbacteria bacterium]|nr:hypothetical protein [Candidatus Gottesmanbacteria bacterium]